MSTEKDFIEYLLFMNRFVVLWEILKYSPETWENYSLVEEGTTGSYVLKDNHGNTILDDDVFDYMVEIRLNKVGYSYYYKYLEGCFFEESEIPDIIRHGLEYVYV